MFLSFYGFIIASALFHDLFHTMDFALFFIQNISFLVKKEPMCFHIGP